MKKIGLAVLMGVMFAMFCALPVAASTLQRLRVTPSSFTIKPGESTMFDVTVYNSGAAITDLSVQSGYGAIDTNVGVLGATNLGTAASTTMRIQLYADKAYAGQSSLEGLIVFSFKDGGTDKTENIRIPVTVLDNPPEPTATPTPDAEKPDVRMVQPSAFVPMTAGKLSKVDITLRNVSSFAASNVQVYPLANKDFTLNMEELKSFNLSARGEKSFVLSVTPDKSVKAGDYEVEFEYTYQNNLKTVTTGKGTIYVKVSEDISAPADIQMAMGGFAVNPAKIVAGDTFTLSANVLNQSAVQVNGVRVKLTGLASDGVSIANATTSLTLGTLASKTSQAVSYTLTTNNKMKTGSYAVILELSYMDEKGVTVTDSFPYYVSVVAKDDTVDEDDTRAQLEITSISRPTQAFGVGQTITISATVKNTGDGTAKNVKLSADPEADILPQTANIQIINKLAPGESQTLTYTFAATDKAKSRNHNIGFTLNYETGESAGATDTVLQYVGVTVSNPEADDKDDETISKSVPKIIVSNYVVEPLIVMAGKEFDLDLTYMNTHSTKGVYNIKVTAQVIGTSTEKGNVFTPVGSSNTFYIESIDPKEETTQHLRMYTVPDAQPKNYILTVRFEYEDEDGNALTATEEVGINVQQVTNLMLGEVYLPSEVYLNNSVYVSFTLQNRGAVNLRNMKVKMEGEGIDATGSEVIIGNFNAGAYDYYDGNFFPTAEGLQEVRIVITYDNDMMEPQERIETYFVNVVAMPDWNSGGDWGGGWDGGYPVEEEQGFFDKVFEFVKKPVVWGSAIGVVVIVGAGITVWQVRKKRQKEMELDE